MPRIFISYRRDDSRAISGRIYDRLVSAFGEENIFKDVDRILPGAAFANVLENELVKCNVLLIIIGQKWVSIADKDGRRRLEDPQDFVRIEVEKGLNRPGLLVIPVLVDDAPVPSPIDLPDSLDKLSSLQVVQVRHDPDFHRDMGRLIDFLKVLQQQEEAVQNREQSLARGNQKRILIGAGLIAALIVVGFLALVANGTVKIGQPGDVTASSVLNQAGLPTQNVPTNTPKSNNTPTPTPTTTLTPTLNLSPTLNAQSAQATVTQWALQTQAANTIVTQNAQATQAAQSTISANHQSTLTARLTQTMEARTFAVYDDFSTGSSTQPFSLQRWTVKKPDSKVTVSHQNGFLTFTSGLNQAAVGTHMEMMSPENWHMADIGRFQADLRINEQPQVGFYANIYLQMGGQLAHDGGYWGTNCTANWGVDDSTKTFPLIPHIQCEVRLGDEYLFVKSIPIEYDTFYTVAIQIAPDGSVVRFYVDDKVIGSYLPSEAINLGDSQLKPAIGYYAAGGSSASVSVDNVWIGLP